MLENLLQELNNHSNTSKSLILQRFFKTWVWEYWEWDKFLWITVPELRVISKKYLSLNFSDLKKLLDSGIHEYRFVALTIIRLNYEKIKEEPIKDNLIEFVLKNICRINNWDLVDTFIPCVFWEYFFTRNRELLYKFVKSDSLWERRISIMTTFYFLKNKDFWDTIKICEELLWDKHDLIHKATWWMLREMGKRDTKPLYDFLDKYHKTMPRTMLRYAIEKLSENERQYYLKK